jgi:hypothetical protein
MTSNLGLGKNLMSEYMANPLSQYQQSAYANSAGTNNQIRSMANTIIPQLSNIQGFDRTNPLAKPAGLNLSGALTSGTANTSGNLGFSVNPGNAQQLADLQAQIAALKAAQAAQQNQAAIVGGSGNGGGWNWGMGRNNYAGSLQSSTGDGGNTPGSQQTGDTGAGRTNDRGGYGSGDN